MTRAREVTGRLRITAPLSFGILHLAPLWPEFRARHPGATLDVTLGDRVVDLVDEGYDLAIRIARLPDSTLGSRRLAGTRMVLCAASSYLRKHGKPRQPAELAEHVTLAYSYWSSGDEWQFAGPEGAVSVRVKPWMPVLLHREQARLGEARWQAWYAWGRCEALRPSSLRPRILRSPGRVRADRLAVQAVCCESVSAFAAVRATS